MEKSSSAAGTNSCFRVGLYSGIAPLAVRSDEDTGLTDALSGMASRRHRITGIEPASKAYHPIRQAICRTPAAASKACQEGENQMAASEAAARRKFPRVCIPLLPRRSFNSTIRHSAQTSAIQAENLR